MAKSSERPHPKVGDGVFTFSGAIWCGLVRFGAVWCEFTRVTEGNEGSEGVGANESRHLRNNGIDYDDEDEDEFSCNKSAVRHFIYAQGHLAWAEQLS